MAQAKVSMAALGGNLHLTNSSHRLITTPSTRQQVALPRSSLTIRSLQAPAEAVTSRRAVLGLVAAGLASESFVQAAFAKGKPIPLSPPFPPFGGSGGTLNFDEARDLQLPYKEWFYLQPLSPTEAAQRAEESAQDIVNVEESMDPNAWPYVQNDLLLKAEYNRNVADKIKNKIKIGRPSSFPEPFNKVSKVIEFFSESFSKLSEFGRNLAKERDPVEKAILDF